VLVSTNPFASNVFDSPNDPNGANADSGINLVYDIPELAPGQSVTIVFITSINTPSDGNDWLVLRADETAVNGGTGDDYMFAARESTSETLQGDNGQDYLQAASAGAIGDSLDGGNGADFLSSGNGADTLTGGNGPDIFYFDNLEDGYVVATNTPFASVGGATTNAITDFASEDVIQILSSAFGDMDAGPLVEGTNFSVIDGSYDGTNAGTNANFSSPDPEGTFIYSTADNMLYYDGNGAGAGYTAVAQMNQAPTASDIEVVNQNQHAVA
jgi:Ca2+-binding RTX toxin-like protein